MKKNLALLMLLLACGSLWAGQVDFRTIPLPLSVNVDDTKSFALSTGMGVAYDASNPEIARNAQFLCTWVEEVTGIRLKLTPDDKHASVRLDIVSPRKTKKGVAAVPQDDEAYTLTVDAKGLAISAVKPVGLFRAAQTLRKALPVSATPLNEVSLPFATVKDRPRFVYRGAHFDTARHFFSVDVIKRYIDMLALHGCNQLHWHLTEDQGWRFEVKALPELAKQGSVREQTVLGRNTGVFDGQRYGGYYTQEQCREIVNYAAERYVNVIPEIDLPGHMQGALHVYPNLGCTGGPYPVWQMWGVSQEVLCAGNPETLTFLKTVLGELCDVFPSKFIHIGGDECPKVRWKECPKCQAKIKELGLTADGKHSLENQLQAYINHEVEMYLASRGRDIIGWDEILEGGLTPGATVMSWRGVKGGVEAARQKHRVIMSPNDYCYIDHYQLKDPWKQPLGIGGYLPASKVYSFEPLQPGTLSDDEQQYILGAQVNLWTEYIASPEHVFYMLLPRLDAISEVQWCTPENKNFDDFKLRLQHMKQLYDNIGVKYCKDLE